MNHLDLASLSETGSSVLRAHWMYLVHPRALKHTVTVCSGVRKYIHLWYLHRHCLCVRVCVNARCSSWSRPLGGPGPDRPSRGPLRSPIDRRPLSGDSSAAFKGLSAHGSTAGQCRPCSCVPSIHWGQARSTVVFFISFLLSVLNRHSSVCYLSLCVRVSSSSPCLTKDHLPGCVMCHRGESPEGKAVASCGSL